MRKVAGEVVVDHLQEVVGVDGGGSHRRPSVNLFGEGCEDNVLGELLGQEDLVGVGLRLGGLEDVGDAEGAVLMFRKMASVTAWCGS